MVTYLLRALRYPRYHNLSYHSPIGICPATQAEHCNTESKNQFLYGCLLLTPYETTLRIFIIRTSVLALSLLVFWVFTDNSDATLSLNDFALFTNWFYRRSNLHFHYSPFEKSPFHIITQEKSFCKCFFMKFSKILLQNYT